MSTAADLLLLATDPTTGRCLLGSTETEAVLGGALLYDLIAAQRLELTGTKRSAKVVVLDPAPLADSALEDAFARVRDRRPAKAQHVVARLGKRARKNLYRDLTAAGRVRPRDATLLGVIPLTRYDVVDTARRSELLTRVREVLLHHQPADETTGPLVGLLSAGDLVKLVVDKPDRRRAKARAKEVAEGDGTSESVRLAVKAARDAMTAGMVAATVGGAVASGS